MIIKVIPATVNKMARPEPMKTSQRTLMSAAILSAAVVTLTLVGALGADENQWSPGYNTDGYLHIDKVSTRNPIIVDNDSYTDVIDGYYIIAKACMGEASVRVT
jgi:hypothetical protein